MAAVANTMAANIMGMGTVMDTVMGMVMDTVMAGAGGTVTGTAMA
jgi:hypothetical protein